jgi:integrase
MPKSRRGTGCVYLRGNVWWIKYHRNGRPSLESSRSSDRDEAERLLKVRLGDIASGRAIGNHPERVRMTELFEDVVDDYRIHRRASIDDVESRIKLHLGPAFGHLRAVDFTSSDVKRYVSNRRSQKAEDSTINRELAVLRRALNLGVQCDPPKVARAIKILRLDEDNVRTGFLEHDQYIRLRDELPERVKLLFVIGYHTGIRAGELRKIEWKQVDLAAREIRLDGPQTKNKRPRTVPIYGEMLEWLTMARQARDQQFPACKWVFSHLGRPLGDVRKQWEPACKRAGVQGLLFHDLRRSAVRSMERAGIPRKVAMAISGHLTEAVYRRYDIVNKQDMKNAAAKLEQYLADQAQTKKQPDPPANGRPN